MPHIIGWESKLTGFRGKGSKELDYETAKRWVEETETKYPEIQHYILLKGDPQERYFLDEQKLKHIRERAEKIQEEREKPGGPGPTFWSHAWHLAEKELEEAKKQP